MERYQDIVGVDGVEAGERDCRPRWDLIQPHLPAQGVLLDVGSNLGYYGLSAVRAAPGVAVVSIEADAEIASRQAALLRAHDTDRICLVQGGINAAVTSHWATTCDWFQATLLLSVLHWLDDPAAVVRDLSSMSEILIAEVPDSADEGACGRDRLAAWTDPLEWFRRQTGRDVTLLGRMARHTSAVPSHLVMVSGPVTRRPQVPYWGYDFKRPGGPRTYGIEFDGRRVDLKIEGASVDYAPGVNLVTLMSLGKLLHPSPQWWISNAMSVIDAEPGHGDPLPQNMLWGPSGIRLIDGDDLVLETPTQSARASIQRNVTEWASNRTTSSFAYVPDRPAPWRRARRAVGRVIRAVVGDALVERLKARLGLYGARPS